MVYHILNEKSVTTTYIYYKNIQYNWDFYYTIYFVFLFAISDCSILYSSKKKKRLFNLVGIIAQTNPSLELVRGFFLFFFFGSVFQVCVLPISLRTHYFTQINMCTATKSQEIVNDETLVSKESKERGRGCNEDAMRAHRSDGRFLTSLLKRLLPLSATFRTLPLSEVNT